MLEGRIPPIAPDNAYGSPGFKPKKMNLQANLHHNKNMNLFDAEAYKRESDVHESVLGSFNQTPDLQSNDASMFRK